LEGGLSKLGPNQETRKYCR